MASDSDCPMFASDPESDFFDEDSDDEVMVVQDAPKSKKAASKMTSSQSSFSECSVDDDFVVEERYKKLSQLEHILVRPDTYIGSVLPLAGEKMYIVQDGQIVQKDITYTPGLFKIFDEIVVNAADNKQRDPNMDKLKIEISPTEISVLNNGKGIPVVLHKETKVYVPSMIFGMLLTGSNFNDTEKKTTGGRNGYGAKLANVFSKKFVVECADTSTGKYFHQVFRNNMSVAEEPTIRKLTAAQTKKGDYVKISFQPDLEKFHMSEMDPDTIGLLSRRAYDIAGTMNTAKGKKLKVSLNGEVLNIKSFADYIKTYRDVQKPIGFCENDRWQIGVGISNDSSLQQISFVNSISTYKGGRHVKYISEQVADHLVAFLKKKNKKTSAVKKSVVLNHLSVFVNCLIDNPSFDSQTKESLNTQVKSFGSTFKLPEAFLKKVEKSDLVDTILSFAMFKDKEQLKKKGGTKKTKLTGIAKLDDANLAGSKNSKDCTLIITEGDSAKSLAVAGLSVVGRDYFGVFPLKGKPLNVRDAKLKDVIKNEEIKNLVDIMGLKYNVKYDESNIKTLRYGHLMIMADQDTDGSHIKGLIINLFHHFWPSLLNVSGFLQQMITPIVKVSKGKRSRPFFTLPEYEQWLESTGNNGKGYSIKYYKGLGTSTSAEAKEYFANLDTHQIDFDLLEHDDSIKDDEDDEIQLPDTVSSGGQLIDMVFSKERVDDRKFWLNNVPKGVFLDYTDTSDGLRFSDFFNKEYILFSKYDNERSIPHIVDGFKPSQRKVLFGCFKRKLTKSEIKVAQLTGYVAEHSAYHHGEASLQATIVNMAQNFVGSNNVNLLTPSGQFGTRRMGGKDAASARYIFTKLEPIARAIFHPDDDDLLNYLNDDGSTIEPEFYVPVIPMVLVNGADGIGTGWSTSVCNYNPREIIANLRRKLNDQELIPMDPYYCGFTGDISREGKSKFVHQGKIERLNDTTLQISELPLKKWTQNYKEFLEAMMTGDAKTPAEIKDFKENHTETTVSFTVTAEKSKIDAFEKDKKGLVGKFKLSGSLNASNMTLFDTEARIIKYGSPEEILSVYFDVRMDFYVKRKENLIRNLEEEKMILANKARFVEEVCDGQLIVSNRKRKEILEDLKSRGYDLVLKNKKKTASSTGSDVEQDASDNENDEESIAQLAKGYEYLLGMKIWSLTYEKAEQLREQLTGKIEQLDELKATSPNQIWLTDLDAVEVALDERDASLEAEKAEEKRAQKKNSKRQTKKKKTTRKKKAKADAWDSDQSSDDDVMMVDSDDDDLFNFKMKPVAKPKKKPAPKIAATKPVIKPVAKKVTKNVKAVASSLLVEATNKRAPSPDPFSDSEDEELTLSLHERMKKKLQVSPPKGASKKRASPTLELLDDSDDEDGENAAAPPQRKKATVAPKKKTAARSKPAPKKKTVVMDIDSSDDDGFDPDDSDIEFHDAPAVVEKTRGRRTTKKVATYALSDDSDSDF